MGDWRGTLNQQPVGREGATVAARQSSSPAPALPDAPDLFDYCALRASLGLAFREPDLSACDRTGLRISPWLAGLLGPSFAFSLFAPQLVVIVAYISGFCVFAALVAWRIWLLLVATTPGFARPARMADLPEMELPVYTILVPMFREAPAVAGLAEAMACLDWPAERIDLILLTETGDIETEAAIERTRWPKNTRHLILPPGAPQTKPRALNYGLQYARGTLACIYDAEDRPHPGQLKAAYAAFARGGEKLACAQAPLAAYNHRQTWLATHWAMEYAVQFGLLLPALARLRLPILLGGTSNHFRMAVLRQLNGWDAWNVTEDADLGVRLARRGYRSTVIVPPTWEEAPETLAIWTGQRSRWLKGFWQTWVVMMRHPRLCLREIGWPGFLALQIMLAGTCPAALVHGPLIVGLGVAWLAGWTELGGAGLWLMLLGYFVNALAMLITPGPRGMRRWSAAITLPFYWPIQTFAAVRALYGWLRAPHFWAKTPHGLTAHQDK
ncbi:MAG: glycosyltransferase [Hyphomonadaceae bacterium]|nr:glycosyltransferase [Hyphomonadaceae bacterium]